MSRTVWRGVVLDQRTADMMDEVARNTGRIYVWPTQGSWSGAAASAGTHAGAGAIDLMHPTWTVADYDTVVREMRRVGFAAWHRTPQQSDWPRHVHGIAVQPGGRGDQGELSDTAFAQVFDYYDGYNGLANNGTDDGPRDYVGVTWEKYQQQMTGDIIVATANFPRRLGVDRQQPHVQALADEFGASVIAGQEWGDGDVQRIRPRGWDWWRPGRAQSAALTWNPGVWQPVERDGKRVQGSYRLHTPKVKTPPRFVVWSALRHRLTGEVFRFGSFHLVAFKTRNPQAAKEFLRQQARLARWLRGGPRRVAMGDLNANKSLFWTPSLVKDAVWETPRLPTHGLKKIDHVLRPKGQPQPQALATYEGLPGDHRALIVKL